MSLKKWLNYLSTLIQIIIAPLIFVIILRILAIEVYKIHSSSMEPSLMPGDFVIVNKLSYGSRILKPLKLLRHKKIEYFRIKGFNQIKKNDIIIFNKPVLYNKGTNGYFFGEPLVKRCIGLPGDTVLINKTNHPARCISNNGKQILLFENRQVKLNLFPNDTSLNWSLENYGPIYVPKKGKKINLNTKIVIWYKNLFVEEHPQYSIKNDYLIFEGKSLANYTFNHDYYFMIGDNFYFSNDSRYWGFVKDENIIGKVSLILFSVNSDEKGIMKIRWNRILKNSNHITKK